MSSSLTSNLYKLRLLLTPSERRRAVVLFCLMVVGMALETLSTGLVIPAIALMTQQDLAVSYPQLQPLLVKLGSPSHVGLILIVMLGLVGIYLVKNLFLVFLAWRQTRFAFGVQVDLSQRLFTTYLRQPYTFHLQRNSAQLIRNVSNEAGMVADAILNSLNIATELLVFIGISALLLAIEPMGAIIAVLILGSAGWVFNRSVRTRITRWAQLRQHHDGLRVQHLYQGLSGAKDIKLLGRENEFLAQYRMHNAQSARVSQHQAMLQQLPRLWLEVLAVVGLAALVSTMLAQGRDVAGIAPILGLFAAAAFRVMPSVNRVLFALNALRYSAPAIGTVHEELKLTTPEAARRRRDVAEPAFQSEIRLSNISFTYPSAPTPALRDISIRVSKGESVGFIGPSGSGKSTLVDVLLGLLAPGAGQVAVDEKDIQKDLRAWQDQIGYVPQSIYLTDDTLRRNVAFGLPDNEIDEGAVKRALRAAQLDEFVSSLPNGIDTVVGERGIRLSGGQRQRIGIARALYHDPCVLVLDEATSSLDSATERGVMQAVRALHGTKTILIVAHRLSTVEHCDRLYQLGNGRVVSEGAPAQLLPLPKAQHVQ